MKLTKEEWEQLDSLLSKVGFGGYYDFMELLKVTAYNLIDKIKDKNNQRCWVETVSTEKDLKTLMTLVNFLSRENVKL